MDLTPHLIPLRSLSETAPRPGPFGAVFSGRRVLLTGHTGFKGGWLTLWLDRLGAEIRAVALPPETEPSLYAAADVAEYCDSRFADINDPRALADAVGDFRPDLIIHMAAQAIVRDGYANPAATFATNVIGTANVLELARRLPALSGVIVVTSDKCYENNEWDWGYRETDPLGGSDPYSASKACTELVAQAYRRSYFAAPEGPQLASVRAGNVIG
ncbi:MAG: NAD-dependent epimerase/dehydratase family protein, partial [Celeribacter sp.]